MADYAWSKSDCRPDCWWYGIPGSGTHYYTDRFGQHWVGGGVYQMYKTIHFECGWMGVPVKGYQWLSEFAAYGQWFEGGAIYYKNGGWHAWQGNMGQTAGRLVELGANPPPDAEAPPASDLPAEVETPAPPATDQDDS